MDTGEIEVIATTRPHPRCCMPGTSRLQRPTVDNRLRARAPGYASRSVLASPPEPVSEVIGPVHAGLEGLGETPVERGDPLIAKHLGCSRAAGG